METGKDTVWSNASWLKALLTKVKPKYGLTFIRWLILQKWRHFWIKILFNGWLAHFLITRESKLLWRDVTWSWVLRRSMGAVIVRETASESPDARTNLFHSPKPDASSGNSMGIARLSPTSKTSGWMKWVITLIIVPLHNASGWTVHCSFCTPLLHWGVAHPIRDLTRLCFHEDTSSPMLSTGLRMTWCRNSPQSTVMELSLSILVLEEQRRQSLCVFTFSFSPHTVMNVCLFSSVWLYNNIQTNKGLKCGWLLVSWSVLIHFGGNQ